MSSSVFNRCGRAVRPRRGSSAVELALVFPFFVLLTLGVVDLVRLALAQMALEDLAGRVAWDAAAGGAPAPAGVRVSLAAARRFAVPASRPGRAGRVIVAWDARVERAWRPVSPVFRWIPAPASLLARGSACGPERAP